MAAGNKSTGTTKSGCFVYRILEDVEVRSAPRVDEEEVAHDDESTNRDGTRRVFRVGDLVSVDLVLDDRLPAKDNESINKGGQEGGPYLRLSDGSGWLCSTSSLVNGNNENSPFDNSVVPSLMVEEMPVEAGLWSFYIDNNNDGIVSQSNPMDPHNEEDDSEHDEQYSHLQLKHQQRFLPPMHRVYCDQRVRGNNGVTFYRLQGDCGCTSWVYDKRHVAITTDTTQNVGKSSSIGLSYNSSITSNQTTRTITVLHPESQVHSGSFAYRALRTLNVHASPIVDESASKTNQIPKNEIVFGDIILEASASGGSRYNNSISSSHEGGPFLRLLDGSGWLSLRQRGVQEMAEVPMEVGKWKLRVKDCTTKGIQLQEQPSDFYSKKQKKTKEDVVFYPKSDVLICDRRIVGSGGGGGANSSKSSSGAQSTFYRVQGTNGWIRHHRGTTTRQLKPGDVEYNESLAAASAGDGGECDNNSSGGGGWSVDFVRGIAAAATRGGKEGGLEEIFYSAQCQVICFRHPGGYRLNVYYTTRTIGTVFDKGGTQFYRHNCTLEELIEILQNPKVHSHHWQGLSGIIKLSSHKAIDMEEDFRNRLARVDKEIKSLLEKRTSLCKSISSHEHERYQQATAVWKQQKQYQERIKNELMTKLNALHLTSRQENTTNPVNEVRGGGSPKRRSRQQQQRTSSTAKPEKRNYRPSYAANANLRVVTAENQSFGLSSFSSDPEFLNLNACMKQAKVGAKFCRTHN